MSDKRKPGRPVTHPNVACIDTGEVFKTYTEAAEAVGGSRYGVMRCCNGDLKSHHGHRFVHTTMSVGRYGTDWYDFNYEN